MFPSQVLAKLGINPNTILSMIGIIRAGIIFECIDIFVREPKPFDELYKNHKDVNAFGLTIPIVGIEDLIELKLEAGRDKDLYDVKLLKKIHEEKE